MWWYRALHCRLLEALAGVHGAVLDAGCGTGGLLARVRAERPDLRPIGLEWITLQRRRAAAKSAAPVVCGNVNVAAICRRQFRCRGCRRCPLSSCR